ncbi:hypothetical protein [Actinocrispum wychmicini]|uniref:Uncharacterized protein n=1 Tax=Actinocrispum wychmicini TaxID=1213861 RepID=A0A4R2JPN4_9PSEU|nr:hypothetical protein [Actinocrispum wychmicini]TCO62133.1 hypothetical protein EV192_102270 [Actinocrispum wychmicini]
MGGSEIDMNVGETEVHVARLGAVGDTLRDEWSATSRLLESTAGRLGGGPMGARFRALYHPRDARLHEDTARALADVAHLASAGLAGIATYVDSDQRSAAELAVVRRDS